MIRAFSLQARPQQRDRSFYAFSDNRPPAIYAPITPVPERPAVQENQQNPNKRHQMHDAHQSEELENIEVQQLMLEQAAVGMNGSVKSNNQAPGPVDFQTASGQAQAKGSRKRSLKSGASPMLSELRTRSHFGVSTQMIIEDVGPGEVDNGNSMPYIKRDTVLTSAVSQNQQRQINNDYMMTQGGRQQQAERRGPANFIRAFNKQLNPNSRISVEEEQQATGAGGKHFHKRGQRGSMVSDTYDHLVAEKVAREKLCRPLDHLANSAEHLSKFQNELANDGYIDLRRMELNMDNVKMAQMDQTVLTSADNRLLMQQTTSGGENVGAPVSPTLNVVLPASIQTGFTDSNQLSNNARAINKQNRRTSKIQNKKNRAPCVRAKSAATYSRIMKHNGPREVTADERLESSVVVMNEKTMAVAQCTTAKGIVSLYNHGFRPKRTGKVSTRSKFAASKKPLYQVEQIGSKRQQLNTNAIGAQTRIEGCTIRTVTENDDLEYSFEGQNAGVKQAELGYCLQEIESGYASFSNIKLELRQGNKDKVLNDSIAAQKTSGDGVHARDSIGTAGIINQSNIFQAGKTNMFGHVNTISEGNLTDPNTAQDKKSRGTSEFVHQSVHCGQIGEGIIDYGASNIPINDQQDLSNQMNDSNDQCQQRSGHFLIMPCSAERRQSSMDLTPKVDSSTGMPLDFNNTGTNITNNDHESRETEADEHAMRPLMQERAGSAEPQQTRLATEKDKISSLATEGDKKTEQVVTTKSKLVKSNVKDANYTNTMLPPKAEKPSRLLSGHRKSVQSKQSLNPVGSRGLIRIDPSRQSKDKLSENPPKLTNMISKESSQVQLNADLGPNQQQALQQQSQIKELHLSAIDTSPKNTRNRSNYSQAMQVCYPKTRSSGGTAQQMSNRAGIRSPNQTSMSQLVGASLMTRPLIGSQVVKKIEAQNSSTNPLQKTNSKIAHMSTDCLQKKNQLQLIHLEIDHINKANDETVELTEAEKKTIQQPDSTNSGDLIGAQTMTLTPKELRSSNAGIRSGITARDLKIESGQQLMKSDMRYKGDKSTNQELNASTSGDALRGQHVLINDQKLEEALLYKLNGGPPPMMMTPSAELISRHDVRNKSQPVMSGYSSRTQQIDAKGKVRHVFLINQPSNAQIINVPSNTDLNKHSSNDKLASGRLHPRKSAHLQKRRRRRRPSSSRLRQRGQNFKLNSDKSTCGEEIATVRGGSTGRNEQEPLSPEKQYANRRVSHNQVASLDIRRPHLGLIYKTDSKTNSNRSLAPNLASSSSDESHDSLRLTAQPSMNQALSSDKAMNDAILSGSVQVSRISLTQQKYFSLEANMLAAMPQANKTPTGPVRPYDSILQNGQLTKHLRASACHSINDYLRHEEISRVKISEIQTAGIMQDYQELVNDQEKHQKQYPQSDPNSLNMTLYQTQTEQAGIASVGEEEKVDVTSGGNQTNMPRLAMYSHMSGVKPVGCNTIETSLIHTDPNNKTVGQSTPGADGVRPNEGQVIFVASSNGERQKEGQMMVVTTIRSKKTHDAKASNATTQDQEKITIEAQERNVLSMNKLSGQEPYHQANLSYVTDTQAHGGAAHHYMSSNTRGSVLSRDQILNMRYTPDRLITDEHMHIEPLVFQQKQNEEKQEIDRRNPIISGVRTPLSADSGTQSPFYGQTQTSEPFNLSASIKLNQQMLKMVQISCQDTSMHNKLVKQDEALERRERCVIPSTIATMPEKIQFQRRLFNEQRQPDLAVVGQQTYTVTVKQLQAHVTKTQEFYDTFNQHQQQLQTQMVELQAQQPHAHISIIGNEARGTLMIQDVDVNESEMMRQSRGTQELIEPTSYNQTRDQGLQSMMREDITSLSGNSQNGLMQIFDPQRRTMGFPGNILSDGFLKQPSTQYQQAFEYEMQNMNDTELMQMRASKEFFTAQEEAQATQAIANINAIVNRENMHTPSTENELAKSYDHLGVTRNKQEFPMSRPAHLHKSPMHNAVTDDGTDIDPSPYGAFKNNPRLQSSNQHRGATRNELSPSRSQQLNLSAEFQKSRMSGSQTEHMQPGNQNFVDSAEKTANRPDVHLRGQLLTKHKTMIPTSFTMQDVNEHDGGVIHNQSNRRANSFARTGETMGEEPQVNTIGVGIDIETVRSSNREQNNHTILLNQGPQREVEATETRFTKEGVMINVKQSMQKEPLISAGPASFDIKVKVGSTTNSTTNRRSTQNRVGSYQGAPPNHFMRKGSNTTDHTNKSNNIIARQQQQQQQDCDTIRNTIRSKHHTNIDETNSGAMSLAVETRNAITGMRKKIVQSAIQSPEPDGMSEQTQTEKVTGQTGQRDYNTLTINAYDTSMKMPSETSQNILRPRGGIGYQQEGSGMPTSQHSIQVTVGRIGVNSSKDRLSPNQRLVTKEDSLLKSQQNQFEVHRKVDKSKSKVYETLGSAMNMVGQKSLQQLGVWGEMTQQQTFNNIREAEFRRQELKEQKELKKQQLEQEGLDKTSRKNVERQNKTMMKEISDLTGGILGGKCEQKTKKSMKKRTTSRKNTNKSTKASHQQLLDDYSVSQNYDSFKKMQNNATNMIQTSKSGVFDLQAQNFSQPMMQNHRMTLRTEPDYSKKSTIQNMMAKRQKESNVPLPVLNSGIPTDHSSLITTGKTPNLNIQLSNYNTEMPMAGFRLQGPNTLSAMTENEPPLEQFSEQLRDEALLAQLEQQQPQGRRQMSYSTTNSLNPLGHGSGKPTRPISSGVYVRNQRNGENNITPTLGVLHEDQQVPVNFGQGRNLGNMRPQTAQQRGALKSAKSKPSLAKGSSHQYWGGHGMHVTQEERTNSDNTQASSVLANRRIASGISHHDQNTYFYNQQNEVGQTSKNYMTSGLQRLGSSGVKNLISRNKHDYATTDKSGAESITTIMHAASPSYTAMRFQQQPSTNAVGKRTRPYSGVHSINTRGSLICISSKQPAVMTTKSLTKNQMQRDLNRQQHHFMKA